MDRRVGEKRERERDARTHRDKEARGEHSPATQETRVEQETGYKNHESMYINMYMQTVRTVTTDQTGETDADA